MSEILNEKKYVLMSIKPIYAEFIKNGEKTVELRRVLPKIKYGDVIVVYETAPVQRITMTCTVKGYSVVNRMNCGAMQDNKHAWIMSHSKNTSRARTSQMESKWGTSNHYPDH